MCTMNGSYSVMIGEVARKLRIAGRQCAHKRTAQPSANGERKRESVPARPSDLMRW